MTTEPTIGSLCSGYGGLEMGVELAIGPVRHAWHGEVDPDASAVLAANWPGVPNLGDITAVDWDQVEPVEILCAGHPCPGESNAGLRRGSDDPRWRWPDVDRAIRALRPRLVVLENVRGHLRRGFGTVIADLAAAGYVGSWTCVRASDVGAAHQRDRVVIVAWPADGGGPGVRTIGPATERINNRLKLLPTPAARDGKKGAGWGDQPGRPLSETVMRLAPTKADRLVESIEGRIWSGEFPLGTRLPLRQALSAQYELSEQTVRIALVRLQSSGLISAVPRGGFYVALDPWCEYAPAIRRWESIHGRPAPTPTEPGRHGAPRLSPRFVEWLLGLPEGHVTKHVSPYDVRGRHRADRVLPAALRVLGNGAVPQQMNQAVRELLTARAAV